MVLDQNTLFSDKQAITGDVASTNSIDLGAPGVAAYNSIQLRRKLGVSKDTPLLIQVVEDFNNLTDLKVIVQSDDNQAFSSPKDVFSQTIPLIDLKKGFVSEIDTLPVIKERYIRLYYDVTGTAPTTGKITAGIVLATDGAYKG
jgi:hypothetical protein